MNATGGPHEGATRSVLRGPARLFARWIEVDAPAADKYVAAWASCRWFGSGPADARLAWSLTLPQMAATLASAVVGYATVNSAGERLIEQGFLNVVLALVVITCVLGPMIAEGASRSVAAVSDSCSA